MQKTLLPKDIDYEKKLPYGSFFSLFPWLVKILNLLGNTIYKFIHRTNSILLFCKFVIKQIKSSIIVTRTTVLKTLLPKDSNYEKKLPYGSFFSLFPLLVKILNLLGNTIYKFIHRTNYILLFCKFVIKQIKSSIIVTRTTVLKTLLSNDSNYEKKLPYGTFFSWYMVLWQ